MAKEFSFKGKNLKELKELSIQEFTKLLPSRKKRSLERGLSEEHKKFLNKLKKYEEKGIKKPVKTHCRNLIILPIMVGFTIGIYNGKSFEVITVVEDMIGHKLGEFSLTRKRIAHSSPGIGATKSSAAASVK